MPIRANPDHMMNFQSRVNRNYRTYWVKDSLYWMLVENPGSLEDETYNKGLGKLPAFGPDGIK
jgi:hypothetical protein